MGRRVRSAAIVCATLLCALGTALEGQAPNDPADARRLGEVLGLHEGSVVADIGAGSGSLTTLVAKIVGATGKVYSTDMEPAQLRELRGLAARSETRNVTVVEGAATKTNLPDGCCDAIFMRDVYHHFGDPPAMNASLRTSLRPNGRLAVVDFAPASRTTAAPGHRDTGKDHGILVADLIQELTAAGFVDVQEVAWSSSGYFAVVGRRPH